MLKGLELLLDPLDTIPLSNNVFRVKSYEETYNTVIKKLYHLGITRFNNITDLDIFDIPVVSVTRPNVDVHQLSAAQGKGTSLLQATVSATMEAVERHGGETYTSAIISNLERINKPHVSPYEFGLQCNKTDLIEWMRGTCLKTGEEVYVPTSCVVVPYLPKKGVKEISSSSSNGISSGNTILEATFHGLLEVIERHHIYEFVQGNPVNYLDLKTLRGEEKKLVDKIEKTGSKICILDLRQFSFIPCVYVSLLSSHPLSPSIMVAGQAAHLDFATAIRRGVTEAIQSHTVSLQGSREDLIRHHSDWENEENQVSKMWEEARENAINAGVSCFEPSTVSAKTICEGIETLIHILNVKGYEKIITLNLTHPDVGIPVVCVVVPGLKEVME